MSFTDLITRMKQFDKNADVIFDCEEPIGLTTDLVMPRRRWFRKDTSVWPAGGPPPHSALEPARHRAGHANPIYRF